MILGGVIKMMFTIFISFELSRINFLGILIFRLVNSLNKIRMFRFVFTDNVCGSIGRGIIVDDYLYRKINFLHQKALYALRNVVLLIVRSTKNGNERLLWHIVPVTSTYQGDVLRLDVFE